MSTLSSGVRHAAKAALLAAILLLAGPAARASELFVSSKSAAPGASALIQVDFVSQGDTIAGIQFDLQYDNSVMSLSASVGDALRNSTKVLSLADPAPGRKRFLIAGLNQTPVVDGTLVKLFVNLSSSASEGVYPLRLVAITGVNTSGAPTPVNGGDGGITVDAAGSTTPLQSAGVLSGASLLPGDIAPGSVLTLLGSGIGPDSPQQPDCALTSIALGGTSVLFDGTPVGLLYAARNQINFLAPFGISGTTQLQVTRQSVSIAALQLSIGSSAPAIFTLDGSGAGPGAILNQDTSVNSFLNPAARGSIVSLYATGAGQMDPPDVSVWIGGLEAKVLYAGAAPTLATGILQVNCVVPDDATPGYTIPITLKIGQTASPAGVTLAIK